MSWRVVATVLIVVFSIILLQGVIAGPLTETSERLNESGDYDNEHFDGNQIISSLPGDWFNMGLVAIFGVMLWGAWRVIREELTRGGL